MSDKAKKLLESALKLTDHERAEIAASLLESLEPPPDADVDEAWKQEVRHRVEQIRLGKATTVPWSQVRDQLFSRLRDSAN